MKTFDEATEVILEELRTPDIWHNNHCRCVEISESPKLGLHCISLIEPLVKRMVDSRLVIIDKGDLVLVVQMMLEVGVAIGQEMEKE